MDTTDIYKSAEIYRRSIILSAEKSISLDSGSGIYFGSNKNSVNKISLNNIYLDGKIDLTNLELMGTINTKLQTSVFNTLNEEIINNKSSKATSDQYGPTYGPTYGDNLGIFNGMGALNGGENGGFIGKTYSELLNIETDDELQMNYIVNKPNKETNEQLPMNIYSIPNYLRVDNITTNLYLDLKPILYLDATKSNSYNGTTWTNLGSIGGNVNMTNMGSFDATDNGGSFNFNGTTNMGILSINNTTLTQCTFVAVVKTFGKSGWAEILNLGTDNLLIGTYRNVLHFYSPTTTSNFTLYTDIWYFLGFTLSSSGTLKFFVNGNKVFTTTISSNLITKNGTLFGIGGSTNHLNYIPPAINISEIKGRFVMISINNAVTADNFLQLAEVQVISNNQNIALGKPTTSSGNYGGSSNGKANDGNTNGQWLAGSVFISSGGSGEQFWEVDLGDASKTIDRIIVYNRTDSAGQRLNNWLLSIFDNDKKLIWSNRFPDPPNPMVSINITSVNTIPLWNGKISTIAAYNYVLSDEQILELYSVPYKITRSIVGDISKLENFASYSYNKSSVTSEKIVYDNFFGNLYPLTANGSDNSRKIYNLVEGNLNLRFSMINGNIVANGYLYIANTNTRFDIINGNSLNVNGNPQKLTNDNQIFLNGNILNYPNMFFRATLNRIGNNINGITSIFNNSVYTCLNLSGTVLDGDFYTGNIQFINNKFDIFEEDFYRYSWHGNSNLKYLQQLEFPTGNIQYPFGNIKGDNILIAGELSRYADGKYISNFPLLPNQIAMLYYYYIPNKFTQLPFNISFKYQLYSQIRGDYFYFQYSLDNAITWNNLIVQSGDIQSIKSEAIYNASQWIETSFFMIYSPKYIFRWVYNKSLDQENGYDTVILSDISITNLKKVVDIDSTNPFDTKTITYSNKFLGDIVASSVSDDLVNDYNLKFYSSNFSNGQLITSGMTNMANYDWKKQRDASAFYEKMQSMYRQSTYQANENFPFRKPSDFVFYTVSNNSPQNVKDYSWRLYSKDFLSTWNLIPNTGRININIYQRLLNNASPSFLDGSELALVYLNPSDGNTSHGAYFLIGPLMADNNFGLLLSNKHYLKFKFNCYGNFPQLGVASYDYDIGNDSDVASTFIKVVGFVMGFWGYDWQGQHSTLLNAFFNTYIAEPIPDAASAIASLHINSLNTLSNGNSVSNWNGYTNTTVSNQPIYYNTGGIYYNPSSYVNFNGPTPAAAAVNNIPKFLKKENIKFNCGTNGGFTIMMSVKIDDLYPFQTYLYCRDTANKNIIQLYSSTNSHGTDNMVLYVQNDTQQIILADSRNFINFPRNNTYSIFTIRVDNSSKTYEMFNLDNFTAPKLSGTFTTPVQNRSNYIVSIGEKGINTGYPTSFEPYYLNCHIGSYYIFDRTLANDELNQMYAWMYLGNTKPTTYGNIDVDKIKYYPDYTNYAGLYNPYNGYAVTQWNDVSFLMEPLREGFKRIYLIYSVESEQAQRSFVRSINFIHDLKFSFYDHNNKILDSLGNFYTKDNKMLISNDGYLSKCNIYFGNTDKSVAQLGISDNKQQVGIISLGGSAGGTGAYNWALRGVYSYANGYLNNGPGGDLDIIKHKDGNIFVGDRQNWDLAQVQKIGLGRIDNIDQYSGCVVVTNYNGSNYSFYSLYCLNGVYAQGFSTPSDRRIKKNIEDIDDKQSLTIIKQIKPKTYQYIDEHSKTTKKVYGFISQEVESILPYATKRQNECIPNLYADGKLIKIDDKYIIVSEEKKLEIITENTLNTIRIIGPKNISKNDTMSPKNDFTTQPLSDNQSLDVELVNVIDDFRLEIKLKNEYIQLGDYFIYGQYVTDFCALDKLSLLPITISALQEVSRIQDESNDKILQLEQLIQSQQSTINRILSHLNI